MPADEVAKIDSRFGDAVIALIPVVFDLVSKLLSPAVAASIFALLAPAQPPW